MVSKVTVIMSVFNEKENELQASINSIIQQTFKDFLFIIVLDNPASIALKKVLLDFEKNDDRISIVLHKSNVGLASSLNDAVSRATTPYLARMDADDIAEPNRLQIEYETIVKRNVDIISTNISNLNEQGQVYGVNGPIPSLDSHIKALMPFGLTVFHPTVMYKKAALEEVGGYNRLQTAEDLDLWLRMIKANRTFYAINKPLLRYRIRSGSMTSNYWRNYLYAYAIRAYHHKYPDIIRANIVTAQKIENEVLERGLRNTDLSQKFNEAHLIRIDIAKSIREKKIPWIIIKYCLLLLASKDSRTELTNRFRYRREQSNILKKERGIGESVN